LLKNIFKIEIPLPTSEARRSIFEHDLVKDDIFIDADWEKYVEKTEKWDCSKVRNFVQVKFNCILRGTP
jgi:SpoVK/Ycf46/Vps4 family AAA+-type ATPase